MLFQFGTGGGDGACIQTHASEHEKHVLALGFVFAGDGDDTEIDRAIVALKRGTYRFVYVIQRHADIAGKNVAGALRHNAERGAGAAQCLGNCAHGAIAARGKHHLGSRCKRAVCSPRARVGLLGLEPACGSPAIRALILLHRRAQACKIRFERLIDHGCARSHLLLRCHHASTLPPSLCRDALTRLAE